LKKYQRVFSLQEANELIPHLDSRIRIIIQNKELCDRRHDTLFLHELITNAEAENSPGTMRDSIEQDFKQLEGTLETIEKEIEEIGRLGCIVRDLGNGRVELPGILDGEPVFFCWKLGDSAIHYYRSAEDRTGKICALY